jgi:hypothetical protein
MKIKVIALCALLWSTSVKADTLIFNGGIGKEDHAKKLISITYNRPVYKSWLGINLSTGIFASRELQVNQIAFVSIAPQIEVKTVCGLYGRASHGIGFISSHTSGLNGKLQQFTKLSVGLYADEISFGLFFQHISSGHVSSGNYGLEHIGVELGVTF